ncbi:NlpC/P60 family protein [Actinotalea sp. AC32]|nr:NlpC/P60 family protein [Actinotalea sp. AC32]
MTATSQRARHRAARRPITPLDDLATAATCSLATVGRRSAVVAASSGLVVTMALPASAAPAENPAGALPAVDVTALTAEARAALATSPVVTVPAEAAWTVETPTISVVADPEPEPEPEPEPAPARSSSTSRSTERAPVAEAAPAPAAEVPASAVGSAVIEIASRYVGVPYVYGGTTPDGFDCSGFTSYVYAQLGISLPRSSADQRYAGTVVSRDQAQPGDLIWTPGHIGIYAGGNTQIDSPRPGKTVQFRNIWQSNPIFIRVG